MIVRIQDNSANIDLEGDDTEDLFDVESVNTGIGPDVWAELDRLHLPREFLDEVLSCVMFVLPEKRVAWLRRLFHDA